LKRISRKVFICLFIAVSIFAVYSVVSERGFYQLGKMMKRRNTLNANVESLRDENTKLAREIDRLRSDPVTLEELARTKLGMVRPGEIVYIFPENTGDDHQ